MVLVAKSKKKKATKARIIMASLITLIVLIVLTTVFAALGFYVDSLDTVFPNVWAEGIEMSGFTVEQVRQALIDDGYENRADGIAITISFPYDLSFSIGGNDVGLTLNAGEAAQAVFNYGRDGSFIANELTYIKSLFSKTELTDLSASNYNPAPLRELTDEYTNLFNQSLFDSDLERSDTHITVKKGTGYVSAVADDVYNYAEMIMQRAIDQNTHIKENYLPESNADDSIDLKSLFDYINSTPVSSVYDPDRGNPNSENYDEEFLGATESSNGLTFDLEAAEELLRNTTNGETVVIPLIILEPELSQEQLRDMLYRDVLGERSVYQDSSAARATNIRTASAAIDGLILQPGETFSYNTVVGPRTEARGYKLARAILSGEYVDEFGGGVCQVSSAMSAALMQTDLEITSRTVHGIMPAYLPGGQDATVSYGSIDFKFRNNSDYPIMLEVTTTGSITVHVKIHGTRVNEVYYKVVSVQSDDSPIEMTVIEREVTPEDGIDLAPGEQHVIAGRNGSRWEVWKYHYSAPDFDDPNNRILDSNGEHVRTLHGKSTYPMRPRIVLYNSSWPSEPPAEPPATEPPTE